jgi:DNA-directed RNA polymerase subunit H (RpoH/RPB5)
MLSLSDQPNRILSIYKSRLIILELLSMENYDTTGYDGFSIREVETMYKNTQLDMLVTKDKEKTKEKKIYVKYYLGKLGKKNIEEMVDDLFSTEEEETPILKKETDSLVIITDDEPNETTIKTIRYKYDNQGIHIVIFNIKRLQFNVRKHKLNPEIQIMTDDEVEKLKLRIKIKDVSFLPEISRFDPLSMSVFMRPNQVCHLIRDSPTSITEDYYRVCV